MIIREETLFEDTVVKFDGKTYPNFGWCVIVVGGSGSGKSTVRSANIPIDARIYDVDKLKGIADKYYKVLDSDFGEDEIHLNGKTIDLHKATVRINGEEVPVGEPYDMSNPRYVSFLHNELKPLSNKLKNDILSDKGADSSRLPNILFDITGKDKSKIEEIIMLAKPLGYKVALIYVYVDVDVAIKRNLSRGREVDINILKDTHRGVKASMSYIMDDPAIFNEIDECWVVLNYDDNDFSDELRYNQKHGVPSKCFKITSYSDIENLIDKYHPMETLYRKIKYIKDIKGVEVDESVFNGITAAYHIEKTMKDCAKYDTNSDVIRERYLKKKVNWNNLK